MFINGFLHSGASILSDFIQDILDFEVANGGDECYFLRENGAVADRFELNEKKFIQSPVQSELLFKGYLIKQFLLGKTAFSLFAKRYIYNSKCRVYWKKINNATNESEKLLLIDEFYGNRDMIYLNAFSLEMPQKLLNSIFSSGFCLFPLRNIYSQLEDIERQNFFFGPFDYNVEYILGKYELNYIRRYAYLEAYEYRLQILESYKNHRNILIIDIERLFLEAEYRDYLCLKLGVNPSCQSYNKLKLDMERSWLSFSGEQFFADQRFSIYHGILKDKITRIQMLIDKLKCGSC